VRVCERLKTPFGNRRTASTCIFDAICPKQGKGAAPILPA
jgi:hypothetical protein